MQKVATAANKTKEHTNMKRWEEIASAIGGWEWRGLDRNTGRQISRQLS